MHQIPNLQTPESVRAILAEVKYEDYQFEVLEEDGRMFLRATFFASPKAFEFPEKQHTRKWVISKHATKSEIVQTAFKLVMTAIEHEARESFLYRGRNIFGPHFSVDQLWEISGAIDIRMVA